MKRFFEQYRPEPVAPTCLVEKPARSAQRLPLIKVRRQTAGAKSEWEKRPPSSLSVNGNQRDSEAGAAANTGATPAPKGAAAAPASLCGMLNIRADDELHEIYVDGEFVGMTPARLSLAAGGHLLELKRLGHTSYRREIKVNGEGEASLRPIPQPRLLDD